MDVEVSCQVPKVPLATFISTLSVLAPNHAYSQSWMVPAPLVARWVTQPRAIMRSRISAAPLRSRCAP